jgi:tetraacyldisaccharide 4'-kinase
LLTPATFREIVSGERGGPLAALSRAALRGAAVPYRAAVLWRNRRFDRGQAAIHDADVPVVSVGNLTLGGTGKTPMVEWLARWFRDRDVRVTIVSRGYGAEAGQRNDEALELEQKLPDVPHLQNPDRVAAVETAIDELDAQLIVLDDGFQHRRLGRDLDIVMIDALEPFGYGHVFPRGMLREPISALARADVIALSRSDMVGETRREEIRREVEQHAPHATWIEVVHQPRCLISSAEVEKLPDSLTGQRVAAFCGIGNPQGFRHTLESCGYEVADLCELPDHHNYGREDVETLTAWVEQLEDVAAVVCTHKDLVKLRVERLGQIPLWAVMIALEIRRGATDLEEKLRPLVEATHHRSK